MNIKKVISTVETQKNKEKNRQRQIMHGIKQNMGGEIIKGEL